MSDIIIEGKNLSDINQSNFQTVGVRSGFYFITNPNATLSVDESNFKYDTLEIHEARLGDGYDNDLFPKELIKHVTIEPWQGRLHYDTLTETDDDGNIIILDYETSVGLSPVRNFTSNDSIFYSYFYTNNVYNSDGFRYKLNNFYFSSLIYENGKALSPHFNLLKNILNYIPDFKQLIRIKSNLYTNLNRVYEHTPHIDKNEPHKTLILYLNTCNGFTRLQDNTIIKSIANNAVILDGNIYHNSSTASDKAIRLTINVNYKSSQELEV